MSSLTLPWHDSLQGLPLTKKTDPEWFSVASSNLTSLLNDHAHCELKAASTGLSFVGRFAADDDLVQSMLALSYEELGHFRQVRQLLEQCGGSLTPPRPDRYVRELRDWCFRQPGGVGAKADACLAAAFVEARSCERFRILAEGFAAKPPTGVDPGLIKELSTFYLNLADAEGRHWETFSRLAHQSADRDLVAKRVHTLAQVEAEIITGLPIEPRMH